MISLVLLLVVQVSEILVVFIVGVYNTNDEDKEDVYEHSKGRPVPECEEYNWLHLRPQKEVVNHRIIGHVIA